MATADRLVLAEAVQQTIDSFTTLDASGDRRSMHKLARRLGKDQPALLAYAASTKEAHGDKVGEAAVFYSTLVWAMFDRFIGKTLQRITEDNLEQAATIVRDERDKVDGLNDRPIHERTAPALVERQPHIYAKLSELIEEDVREDAITPECGIVVYEAAQVIIEAFDAAICGRRSGEQRGPIVRTSPKIGRNDPCLCGSKKKYKRCCGNV